MGEARGPGEAPHRERRDDLKASAVLLGALAPVLLAGCATTASSASARPSVAVFLERNDSAPKRMTSIPASLGLLAPDMPHYRCAGGYEPAARVQIGPLTPPSQQELPFWQFGLTCAPQKLSSDLKTGAMLPGVVGVSELPTVQTSLLGAIRFLTAAKHLRLTKLGKFSVGVGQIHFAQGPSGNFHLVWYLGGKTTYRGVGRTYHRQVLVYLTGRGVSVATLEKFATSMRPLVR